jgi:hypothetical protein
MVEFGVDNVAGDPNLTFILFVGLVLLLVLGVRFGYYAYRNRVAATVGEQRPIWTALCYVGVLAAAYGAAGILDIVSSLRLSARSAAALGMTLALAVAVQRIYATTAAGDDGASALSRFERPLTGLFVAAVLAHGGLLAVAGESVLSATLEGMAALAFVAYGLAFYRAQTAGTRFRGTVLDSLLRHLLPVLAFGGLICAVSLTAAVGLDPVVIEHIQAVLIIMTATALMSGTIKLRQNIAGR